MQDRARRVGNVGIVSLLLLLLSSQVAATTMIRLPLDERVLKAAEIIVATVVEADATRTGPLSQFIETEFRLRVEDVVVGTLQVNEQITLRILGGTIGSETQGAAGVRLPQVGKRYVLMLTPTWRTANWDVIVGVDQGLFEVVADEQTQRQRVLDFRRYTLETVSASRVLDAGNQAATLPEFVSWMKQVHTKGAVVSA